MEVPDYYQPGSLSAAFYDLVTAADTRLAGDVEIYAALAPPGGSVLELGAGSGRLTAALAERGFNVTGVDIAPAMLAQARARQAAVPADVAARMALLEGDMTALDLGRTFDLVLCPFFTLAHVAPPAAWTATFATAARHLEPGGRAAFHLPLREIMALPGPDPARAVLDLPLPTGGRLTLYVPQRTFRDERMDQVVEYVERDADGNPVRRSAERLIYHIADPVPLAATAGLVFDRPPIGLGGVGEVWVFRKA